MPNLDFIDCSHWNGEIPWNRFRDAGVRGGIVKVTDMYFMPPTYRTHIDPQFARNWQALDTFDLRGAYGYLRWDVGIKTGGLTMRGHVKLMVDTIGDHKEKDILALDEEQPLDQIRHISKLARAHMLEDALKEAEKYWDKEYIWNYSAKWWWNDALPAPHIDPMPYILSFPSWMAYYGSFFNRNIPRGWTNPIAWQYKIGKIEGKRIDHNNFLWNWDDYLKIQPEPPPPPDEEDTEPVPIPDPPKSWLQKLIEFIIAFFRNLGSG